MENKLQQLTQKLYDEGLVKLLFFLTCQNSSIIYYIGLIICTRIRTLCSC